MDCARIASKLRDQIVQFSGELSSGWPELLILVVVRGLGLEPLMVLTSLPVKRSRKSVWHVVAGGRDDPVHQTIVSTGRHPASDIYEVAEHDAAGYGGGVLHDGLSQLEDKASRPHRPCAPSCPPVVRDPRLPLLCPGRRDQGSSFRPKAGPLRLFFDLRPHNRPTMALFTLKFWGNSS
jgi:hypothetical protein